MVKFFLQHFLMLHGVACTCLVTSRRAGARALIRFDLPSNILQQFGHTCATVHNNFVSCYIEMLLAFGKLLHNVSQRDPTML